jgi:hypothetical protein
LADGETTIMTLVEKKQIVDHIEDNTSTFLFGNIKDFTDTADITNLPTTRFGLIVASNTVTQPKEFWFEMFKKFVNHGAEWFASYGDNSEYNHDLFDDAYLSLLSEKGETEDKNSVLITIWNDTLEEALEDFDLINRDRSGNRMETAVVLE